MRIKKSHHLILNRHINLELKKVFGNDFKFKLNFENHIQNIQSNETLKSINETGILVIPFNTSFYILTKVNKMILRLLEDFYLYVYNIKNKINFNFKVVTNHLPQQSYNIQLELL
jgi:hypothetical protein